MNRFYLKIFLSLAFVVSGHKLCAAGRTKICDNTFNDTLKNLVKVAFDSNPLKLFVHYDKNVYVPAETIWLTAYRPGDNGAPGGPDVLSVALVKNNDHAITASKKFVVTGIASSGNMLIPDSVTAGDYTLIAYTNHFVKGRPDELFLQRIVIKRPDQQKTETPKIATPLQSPVTKISVMFYPEGGDLIADLPTYVGWEAKDGAGQPMALKAILLLDGKFADTITTAESGIGRFFIKPKYGHRYEIKVVDKNEQRLVSLPAVVLDGVALTVPSSVVNDTLLVKVSSTLTGKVHIVIHNTRKVFYALTNVNAAGGRIFKLALDSLPKGLAAITVYNSDMQPCAERVFYAHYSGPPSVPIKPDQEIYGKRKKVTVHLGFNSAVSQQGVVSIACVRTNQLDRKNFNDIESFAYLDNSINNLPSAVGKIGQSANARKYVEDLLLVRGWRRYHVDYPQIDTPLQFGGLVTIHNKPAKKPVMLVLFRDSIPKPLFTDNSGRFIIANEDMVVTKDKQLTLMATGYNTENTQIQWADPYTQSNLYIAKLISPDTAKASSKMGSQPFEPSISDSRVMLKQVTIKSKTDPDLHNIYEENRLSVNECGDYVCPWGVLNCPAQGHDRNTHQPIKGKKYGNVIYKGCVIFKNTKKKLRVDGINVKKEFYSYGDADITLPEPLYENTLYWKNQLNIEKGKEVTFSFYTGDIKAGFSIIVQGVADNELIFSENHFEVE